MGDSQTIRVHPLIHANGVGVDLLVFGSGFRLFDCTLCSYRDQQHVLLRKRNFACSVLIAHLPLYRSFVHPFVCCPCKLQSVLVSTLDNFIGINKWEIGRIHLRNRPTKHLIAMRGDHWPFDSIDSPIPDCRLLSTAQRQSQRQFHRHRRRRQYLQSMTGCRSIHCLFSPFSRISAPIRGMSKGN